MVADEEDELASVQDEAEARRRELAELEPNCERQREDLLKRLERSELPAWVELDKVLAERFPVKPERPPGLPRAAQAAGRVARALRAGRGVHRRVALLRSGRRRHLRRPGRTAGRPGALRPRDRRRGVQGDPTEALVPMVRSRRWVLVGDERQLPPFVDSGLVDEGLLEGHNLTRGDLEETLFATLASTLPEDPPASPDRAAPDAAPDR